jgi:hypothetical protein
MIIIIIRNTTVLPNALGSTVAFPMLRESAACDFL